MQTNNTDNTRELYIRGIIIAVGFAVCLLASNDTVRRRERDDDDTNIESRLAVDPGGSSVYDITMEHIDDEDKSIQILENWYMKAIRKIPQFPKFPKFWLLPPSSKGEDRKSVV